MGRLYVPETWADQAVPEMGLCKGGEDRRSAGLGCVGLLSRIGPDSYSQPATNIRLFVESGHRSAKEVWLVGYHQLRVGRIARQWK